MRSLQKGMLTVVNIIVVLAFTVLTPVVIVVALGLVVVLPILEILSVCVRMRRTEVDTSNTEKSDWLTAMTGIKNEMLYNIWILFCCFLPLGKLGLEDILPITCSLLTHMMLLVVWIPWRWIADARHKRRHG